MVRHRYGLRVQVEGIRQVTLWMRIAYNDRSNNPALRWIREYWLPFERMERGETDWTDWG